MKRRAILATAGTALSPPLVVCLSNGVDPSSGTPGDGAAPGAATSPTSTPGPALAIGDPHETASGETVTVAEILLRRSVFDLWYPDAVRPLAPSDAQFVFLALPLDDPAAFVPDAGSFRLRLDDESHAGATGAGGVDLDFRLSVPNDGIHPSPETAAGNGFDRASVAFEVPLHAEPARVLVEWVGDDETARWAWDDDLVRALRNPPDFRVEAVELPDEFACGEPFDAAVTVANDGGREDVFHAVAGAAEPARDGHPAAVSVRVPAGGAATWTGSLRFPPLVGGGTCDADVRRATFELDWGTATREVTVERRA